MICPWTGRRLTLANSDSPSNFVSPYAQATRKMPENASLESSLLRSSPEPTTNYSSMNDRPEDCEVGDLDFCQKSSLQFPSTSEDCLVYASILIDDATHGRAAALYIKSKEAMYAYKEYRSSVFRNTIFVTCWVLLILTFFEGVSYKTVKSTEPLLSLSITSPIETICVIIFAYNCYLEYISRRQLRGMAP